MSCSVDGGLIALSWCCAELATAPSRVGRPRLKASAEWICLDSSPPRLDPVLMHAQGIGTMRCCPRLHPPVPLFALPLLSPVSFSSRTAAAHPRRACPAVALFPCPVTHFPHASCTLLPCPPPASSTPRLVGPSDLKGRGALSRPLCPPLAAHHARLAAWQASVRAEICPEAAISFSMRPKHPACSS